MHIGIEVKTTEVIIVKVSGDKNTFGSLGEKKIPITGDSVNHCIDFRTTFDMVVREIAVSKISMISCMKESSKIRVIIEYIIEEVAHSNGIPFETFATSQLNTLKTKTFPRQTGQEFDAAFEKLSLHKYSQNAFVVAWRYL